MILHSLYICLIGSHAYGLVTPNSDIDLRGVVMPDDLAYYFGLATFDKPIEYKNEEDHVAWGLLQFAALLAKCNTQMLEMLFAEKDSIRHCHPVFEKNFIQNRKHFITKNLYHVIKGYALSEHKKALGESLRDLGLRRKTDLAEAGYSFRNASHCIRLLYSGSRALHTGEFPVRLDGDIQRACMELKLGTASLEDYEALYKIYLEDLEAYYADCVLPETINRDWLNKILVDTHQEVLHI